MTCTVFGAVDVRRAYSWAVSPENEGHGCKYVKDRMLCDRDDITRVCGEGAKSIVCGSKALGDQ